jgi:hypothetical protein
MIFIPAWRNLMPKSLKYGFSARKDLLAQLLALNLEVAGKIEKGEPVAPPPASPKTIPIRKSW